MTVLVTGGFGFLGTYIVRALLARGDQVVVLDRNVDSNTAQKVLGKEESERIKVVAGDIADPDAVNRAIKENGVERIAHIAALLAADFMGNVPLGVRVNTVGTVNVFQAAHESGVNRVVWASSNSVFGTVDRFPSGRVPNDATQCPLNVYAASKSFNEHVADHYYRSYGLDTIGLRFNLMYGKGAQRGATDKLEEALFAKPARHEPSEVPYGDDRCAWQHIEDAAGTVVAALDAPKTITRTFNTCCTPASVREVADIVRKYVPDARFTFLPGTMNVPADFDDSRVVEELGYRAKISMEEGVRMVLRGYGVDC